MIETPLDQLDPLTRQVTVHYLGLLGAMRLAAGAPKEAGGSVRVYHKASGKPRPEFGYGCPHFQYACHMLVDGGSLITRLLANPHELARYNWARPCFFIDLDDG